MNFDEEMRAALTTFTVESTELLQEMESYLLLIEDEEEPSEQINAIFRAAHTIKGSAGLFGLDHIVAFAHVVETVLDQLRAGKLPVSSELVAALLPCCDHLALLINGVIDGQLDAEPTITADGQILLAALNDFIDSKQSKVIVTSQGQDKFETIGGGGDIDRGNWHLSLRFGLDSLRDGMDPLSFIRYLGSLGTIVYLSTITQGIPAME